MFLDLSVACFWVLHRKYVLCSYINLYGTYDVGLCNGCLTYVHLLGHMVASIIVLFVLKKIVYPVACTFTLINENLFT